MDSTMIYRCSNAGENLGALPYESAIHDEDLSGADRLTVKTFASISKRDRLVWQDNAGDWHEHMADNPKRSHSGGRAVTTCDCSNSISELYGVIANGTRLSGSVQAVLTALLSGTRWTVGACSDFGTVEIESWHRSVRECIAELCTLTGGELVTEITVGAYKVTRRTVRIVDERGGKTVTRQFSYGRNVSGAKREVAADEVYTAIVGYGAKLDEEDDSDYAERLTVTVESGADLSKYGIPKPDGTFAHNFTTYTDNACTSAAFLTRQCKKILDSVDKPLVCYEFDVVQGDDDLWRDVRLGNRVSCVDSMFDPSIEVVERVSHIRRSLSGRMSCTVRIGARPNPTVEYFKAANKVAKQTTGNSVATTASSAISTLGEYSGGSHYALPESTPESMKITRLPNKLSYVPGETIDYSGIQCTLYTAQGTVYSDKWHTQGIIPFSELEFPIKTAYMSSQGVYGMMQLNGEYTGNFDDPSPVYSGIMGFYVETATGKNPYTYVEFMGAARMILWEVQSNRTFHYMVASKEPVIVTKVTKRGPTHNTSGKFVDTETVTIDMGLQSHTTYTDPEGTKHDVYYFFGSSGMGVWRSLPNHSSGGYYPNNYSTVQANRALARQLLYNDVDGMFHDDSIPVLWTRSDGTVLQDSFKITVDSKLIPDEDMPDPYDQGYAW